MFRFETSPENMLPGWVTDLKETITKISLFVRERVTCKLGIFERGHLVSNRQKTSNDQNLVGLQNYPHNIEGYNLLNNDFSFITSRMPLHFVLLFEIDPKGGVDINNEVRSIFH